MKYLSQLFLVLSVLFIQNTYCQSTVYVKTNQFGRGFLKMRGSECFVVTPEHLLKENKGTVIKNYNGPITVFGEGSVRSRANLLKSYAGDLAVLRFEGTHNQNCKKWQLNPNYNTIIETATEGFLELREIGGGTAKVAVNITGIGDQNISIQPKDDSGETFYQGMSGSTLFVEYQGKKVFLGMLQSIKDEKMGSVIRADEIDKLLSSFFKPPKTQHKSSIITDKDLTREVLDFKFDLLNINKSGDRVTFTFDVTSLKSDKELQLSYYNIFLYDEDGLEQRAKTIVLGSKSHHNVDYHLVKNTPVPMKIIFTNVPSSSQFASLLKVGVSTENTKSTIEYRELYFGDESEDLSAVIEDKGNWSKVELGFKYELLSYEKIGTDAVFTFTVTNLESDKMITLGYHNILLYDDKGLETKAKNISIGSKSYHLVDYFLIKDIPTPLIISFKDLASSAKGVALLKVGFTDNQNKGTIQIRNLTFPVKTAATLGSKVNTTVGKPSTTCSEIYFYRKRSMLECVETVYLYNHGELMAKLQPGVRYKSVVCDDRSFRFSVKTNPKEIALSASQPEIVMGKKYYLKISCALGVSTISLQENEKGEKDITNNSKFKRKLTNLPLTNY